MEFNEWLRTKRLQSNLGVRELAKKVGISGAYVSRLERPDDPAKPSAEMIARLARVLGTDDLEGCECAGVLPDDVRMWVLNGGKDGWEKVRQAMKYCVPVYAVLQGYVDRLPE